MRSEDVKIGMPVKRPRDGDWYKKSLQPGEIGIVVEVNDGEYRNVELDLYPGHYSNSGELEPAYALEVGCKVRVVDYADFMDGKEGRLHSFSAKPIVRIDGTQYPIKSENLIVIEPAPHKYETESAPGSDVAMFSKEDIEKCMKDIENQEMDIYGKSALKINNPAKNDIICGIDFASPQMCRCSIISHDEFNKIYTEEWKMIEIGNESMRKLAEKVKDELVGYDPRSNTVFLKMAGEVKALKREIVMTLTDADIEKLLKTKGLDATLGDYEIKDFVESIVITTVKFEPVQKELNEAV